MSAPRLSRGDGDVATGIAGHIGAEFKAARLRAGDQQKNVAYRLGVRTHIVTRFEAGAEKNIKLGRAVRFLRLYGLTLAVVPIARAVDDVRADADLGVPPSESPIMAHGADHSNTEVAA